MKFLFGLIFVIFSSQLFAQIPSGNPDCAPGDGIMVSFNDGSHIYVAGHGADTLPRVPYVAKIDTTGTLIWNNYLGKGVIGIAVNMILQNNNLYVLVQHDSAGLGTTYYDLELFRINPANGSIIWRKNIHHSDFYELGYGTRIYQKEMIQHGDTAFTLLMNKTSANNDFLSYLFYFQSLTGNFTTYIDSTKRRFEHISTDTLGNYYAIAYRDTVYSIRVNDPDSVNWKTRIDTPIYNNDFPERIFVHDDNLFLISSNHNEDGRVIKMNRYNGNILWNTEFNSQRGGVYKHVIDQNNLYIIWNSLHFGGGLYWLKTEKLDMDSGIVRWKADHFLINSSGEAYSTDLAVQNGKVAVTGYGVENNGMASRKHYWFNMMLNENNGNELYYSKTLHDTSKYEFFSVGRGVQAMNGQFYYVGNIQDLSQMSPLSQWVQYPKTEIAALKLDANGNRAFFSTLNFGTASIQEPWISDTTICLGDTVYLLSNNNSSWSHTWRWNNSKFSSNTSTYYVPGLNGSIKSVISNGQCSRTRNWPISVTSINTTLKIDSAGLLISNQVGASYQWIDCNTNLPLPGDTNFIFTPTANGSYAVNVTQGACSRTSDCIDVNYIGIQRSNNEINFKIFPVPVEDILNVQFEHGKFKPSVYKIYDYAGKMVDEGILKENKSTISIQSLSPGFYQLRIDVDKSILVEKFTIYRD